MKIFFSFWRSKWGVNFCIGFIGLTVFLLNGFSSKGETTSLSVPSPNGWRSPMVSANALFLYQQSNFHQADADPAQLDETPNGMRVQEAELAFYADVDPYSKLYLNFSVSPEWTSDGTTISQGWSIEPEEAYVESAYISPFILKVGKFKGFWGKHNMLHSHALPFVGSPLANVYLLGEEGLSDVGVSVNYLFPWSWYSDISLQFLNAKGENGAFNSPSPGKGAYLLHSKNLIDLNEDLTIEIGLSGAQGQNSYHGETNLLGSDLTFKWRPSQYGRYASIVWANEYTDRQRTQTGVKNEHSSGWVTWLQLQFAERWAFLYRYDQVLIKNSFDSTHLPDDSIKRHSIALNFIASEFSSFKFEYDLKKNKVPTSNGETEEKVIYLQGNFTIGAHPAHSY